jgi:hypothetical protein
MAPNEKALGVDSGGLFTLTVGSWRARREASARPQPW